MAYNMNSIRQVFGNHNSYSLFINLVRPIPNMDLPLPKPILSREVNGPDAETINSKTKHNILMIRLSEELITKYQNFHFHL